MDSRWTTYGKKFLCTALLIIVLEIHVCRSFNSEGLALFQFRAKLESDPSGALANWNPDDCDPCMWSGVECLDGNVVVLDLNGHDLKGALAPELGNLTHLRFLDLSKNHLSGDIPPQFGQLVLLEVLDLRDNHLRGRIPTEIGEMRSLKRLLLCNNGLDGSVPLEIEKLSSLTNLQLDCILTTADAAGYGCTNRKFGHWFSFGHALPQNHAHADDSCIKLTDSEQHMIENTYEEVNSVRRILVEQSSNLVAIPPKVVSLPLLEPGVILPSRSSGSFPTVPPFPPPAPSPPPTQQNKPPSTTYPVVNSESKHTLMIGIIAALLFLILLLVMLIVFRKKAAKTIVPWKSGLSGQLQKAFVTGVPKLKRDELETACEDFSNIIQTRDGVAILYKGTLSSGVEIAVTSTAIASLHEWSKRAEVAFRKKIDSLSRVNHKNFVNLLGYCEENKPFTRMMVFEYAPNGTLFEHLHVQEYEHLDWDARMRIIMGTAYCLLYMHELNPPIAVTKLTTEDIALTDDYAAKIADRAFWEELITESKTPDESDSSHNCLLPLPDVDTNIYSFGLLLLEIISGRLPYTQEQGDLLNWASQHFKDKAIKSLVDPALESSEEKELEVVCDVIQLCTQQDARTRPTMQEAVLILRQVIQVSPEAAQPRLSPLWWAELEILSQEAA